VALSPDALQGYDAGLICTDHDGVDYAMIARDMDLVIDTRNALRAEQQREHIQLA
jgi:UDP-N-acetyl-D-glucosamine dehydrogenase